MKSFIEHLNESKKTYEFKVGVAGDIPEGFEDRLEMSLKKYGLSNLSSGKRTPITERPLDFPQLQNTEVTYWVAEVNYPTTVQVLQQYLGEVCSVPQSHIIVRNTAEPQEEYQETKEQEPYESLLNTADDMGGESAQDDVGGNRVMDLLKELEIARKEREIDSMEGAPKGKPDNMDESENSKSPIGS